MPTGFRILRSADDRPRVRVVLAEAVIIVLEVAIRRVVESKVLSDIRNVLHRRGRRVEVIARGVGVRLRNLESTAANNSREDPRIGLSARSRLGLRDRRPGDRTHSPCLTRIQLPRTEELRSYSEERSTVGWIRSGVIVVELVVPIALVVDRAVERVGDGDPNERSVRILNRGTSRKGRQRVENEGRGAERSNDQFLGQAHEGTSLSVDG